IASWTNGYGYNDFNYCEVTLYQTKKGAWFLLGEGGANSGYSSSSGDSRGPGKSIDLLIPEEALAWLTDHNEVDLIEEYFADSVEEG
ncbi:hypothetical protein LCGC14_2465380, partial [marine sediment metagenome]